MTTSADRLAASVGGRSADLGALTEHISHSTGDDPLVTGSRVTGDDGVSVRAVRGRVARHLVGRARELDLLLAAVAAGRDVLLEGPPGTSKSTLLRSITAEWGIPLVFVEGNADLTPTRLVGHHDPARVLREDYSPDNFVPGPLIEAMSSGGFAIGLILGGLLTEWLSWRAVLFINVPFGAVMLMLVGAFNLLDGIVALAAETGVRSSLSLPLPYQGSTVGALNCYSREPAAFATPASLDAGLQVAEAVAVAVGNAEAHAQLADQAHNMRIAMDSRAVIEQAKGVIMASMSCDADTAFDVLRHQSQSENRKLRDIAQEIVQRQRRK